MVQPVDMDVAIDAIHHAFDPLGCVVEVYHYDKVSAGCLISRMDSSHQAIQLSLAVASLKSSANVQQFGVPTNSHDGGSPRPP